MLNFIKSLFSRRKEGTFIKREGHQQDILMVADANKKMDAAILQARQTLPQFIAALQSPSPTQSRFIIKLPVSDGRETEHMWMSNVTYDGTEFVGILMDDPHNVRGYQMRQTVRVTPDKITDWAYGDNGEMIGGYTQIVLQEMYGDSD
jgi:uncharacterized protein YegJ (DUF2314 family)